MTECQQGIFHYLPVRTALGVATTFQVHCRPRCAGHPPSKMGAAWTRFIGGSAEDEKMTVNETIRNAMLWRSLKRILSYTEEMSDKCVMKCNEITKRYKTITYFSKTDACSLNLRSLRCCAAHTEHSLDLELHVALSAAGHVGLPKHCHAVGQ